MNVCSFAYHCRCWVGRTPICLHYICLLCSPVLWKLCKTPERKQKTVKHWHSLLSSEWIFCSDVRFTGLQSWPAPSFENKSLWTDQTFKHVTPTGTGGIKDSNSRVALDRVGVAVDTGGGWLCYVALEEGVAVGVGVFSGTDVGVEWVCGRANWELLRSHWLGCWDDKVM